MENIIIKEGVVIVKMQVASKHIVMNRIKRYSFFSKLCNIEFSIKNINIRINSIQNSEDLEGFTSVEILMDRNDYDEIYEKCQIDSSSVYDFIVTTIYDYFSSTQYPILSNLDDKIIEEVYELLKNVINYNNDFIRKIHNSQDLLFIKMQKIYEERSIDNQYELIKKKCEDIRKNDSLLEDNKYLYYLLEISKFDLSDLTHSEYILKYEEYRKQLTEEYIEEYIENRIKKNEPT